MKNAISINVMDSSDKYIKLRDGLLAFLIEIRPLWVGPLSGIKYLQISRETKERGHVVEISLVNISTYIDAVQPRS